MMSTPPDPEDHEITTLLQLWSDGDEDAAETLTRRLLPLLRRVAAGQLSGERPHHTLQATALVNEAYSRLLKRKALSFECRGQFFKAAATIMRQILVDHARARNSHKRGSGQELLPLEKALGFAPERSGELIQLDETLDELTRFNPEGAKVVELRFFVGLGHQEIAEVLEISHAKARRLWTEAKAWLYMQMRPDDLPPLADEP